MESKINFGDKILYGLAALGVFFVCDTVGILFAVRNYFGVI